MVLYYLKELFTFKRHSYSLLIHAHNAINSDLFAINRLGGTESRNVSGYPKIFLIVVSSNSTENAEDYWIFSATQYPTQVVYSLT